MRRPASGGAGANGASLPVPGARVGTTEREHLCRYQNCPAEGATDANGGLRCEWGRGSAAVQGRSLSGLRMIQMRVIRSAATSNANTVTVTPSCWATRPGWPLTVRSRIVRPGARPAMSAR